MKTELKKQGDTLIVTMNGRLSYESQGPLKERLTKVINHKKSDEIPTKLIFNLKDLDFVGSSGISSFVHTLKGINQKQNIETKYCNVGNEFRKIIQAFDDEQEFEFFSSEQDAHESFEV